MIWFCNWLIVFFCCLGPVWKMSQSCPSAENPSVVKWGYAGQDLYNAGPHPHSWLQLCPLQPSGTVHHFRSRHPSGDAFSRRPAPVWPQYHHTWKVGAHGDAAECSHARKDTLNEDGNHVQHVKHNLYHTKKLISPKLFKLLATNHPK